MRKIYIDDAGWGFPLGGVFCGIYDTLTGRIITKEVPVEYFYAGKFEQKGYLTKYAELVLDAVKGKLDAGQQDTQVIICTGYVNSRAKLELLKQGYKVKTGKIGDPLQTELERRYGEYIRKLGYEGYYTPDGLSKAEIAKRFYKAVKWAIDNGNHHLLKSGWKYFTVRHPEIMKKKPAIPSDVQDKKNSRPYIHEGFLIIPFNSDSRYHWWNGGQSVVETLKEMGADSEVIKRYSS